MVSGEILLNLIFISVCFIHFFAFRFPLQPLNMNSKPNHTQLTKDFSRNISIEALLKYLQWLDSEWHFSILPIISGRKFPSCHNTQTKELIFIKAAMAFMINISMKSQPHRAYGFWRDNFLSIFFFRFFFHLWFPWQPIQTNSGPKYIADISLFKEHFYRSFFKISWQ